MSETSAHDIKAALSTVKRAADDMEALTRNLDEVDERTIKAFATTMVTSIGAVVAQLQHLNNLGYFAEDSDSEDSSLDWSGEEDDFESSNDDVHDEDIEDNCESEGDTPPVGGSVADRLPVVTPITTARPRKRAAPAADSVSYRLAEQAGSDPELKDVLKVVVAGEATKEQLRWFEQRINELGEEDGDGGPAGVRTPAGELHDTRGATKRRSTDLNSNALNASEASRYALRSLSNLDVTDGSSIVAVGDAVKE